MKIRILNKSKHKLPAYSTALSARMDIRANIDEDIVLEPMERTIVNTGLYLEIPDGFEAQIRPGSGLTIKNGITILNSLGTIDTDYRGEVCIILINISKEDFVIKDGDRICQMVIAKHEKTEWVSVENIIDTDRGKDGFGHTGKG